MWIYRLMSNARISPFLPHDWGVIRDKQFHPLACSWTPNAPLVIESMGDTDATRARCRDVTTTGFALLNGHHFLRAPLGRPLNTAATTSNTSIIRTPVTAHRQSPSHIHPMTPSGGAARLLVIAHSAAGWSFGLPAFPFGNSGFQFRSEYVGVFPSLHVFMGTSCHEVMG